MPAYPKEDNNGKDDGIQRAIPERLRAVSDGCPDAGRDRPAAQWRRQGTYIKERVMNSDTRQSERMFLKLYLKSQPDQVTDEELDYFREHPEQIDEVTAPVNVHKLFLWSGTLLGIIFVGVSKALKFHPLISSLSEGIREFGIDIVFEIGVALIGAAVTAYILGILLDRQQENAAKWRSEIRRRLEETD
jgi:hypothetical protein